MALGCSGSCRSELVGCCRLERTAVLEDEPPTPLFERLDLEEILAAEQNLVEEGPEDNAVHGVKGGKKKGGKPVKEEPEGIKYLEFDTFMQVNLRVGTIQRVEDHPNADKLYVVHLDDGTDDGRTICAGLKAFYSPDEMVGKQVVFVENLKPRPLRGVVSEGMMLAADNGNGDVRLITIDGAIEPEVRFVESFVHSITNCIHDFTRRRPNGFLHLG